MAESRLFHRKFWRIVFVVSFVLTVSLLWISESRGDVWTTSDSSTAGVCENAIAAAGFDPPHELKYRSQSAPFFGKEVTVCAFRYYDGEKVTRWRWLKTGSQLTSTLLTLGCGFLGMTIVSFFAMIVYGAMSQLRINPPKWFNNVLSASAFVGGVGLGIFYMYWS